MVRYAGVRGRIDLGQAITESATKGLKGLPNLDRALALLQALPPAQIGTQLRAQPDEQLHRKFGAYWTPLCAPLKPYRLSPRCLGSTTYGLPFSPGNLRVGRRELGRNADGTMTPIHSIPLQHVTGFSRSRGCASTS